MNSFSPLMNEIYLNIWLSRNSSVGLNPMTDSLIFTFFPCNCSYMLFDLFFSFFLSGTNEGGSEGGHGEGSGGGYRNGERPIEVTPSLNDKIDSEKSHLQDLARWRRTSEGVDIPKISQFYWALFEKTRFLCFYIIKSSKKRAKIEPKYP